MAEALKIAQKSGADVPVGALIVKDNKIIASSHNEREKLNDITAHAEILVIKQAEQLLNNWRLDGCVFSGARAQCPFDGYVFCGRTLSLCDGGRNVDGFYGGRLLLVS